MDTIFIRLNYGAPDFELQVKNIVSDPNGGIILLATEMQEEDFQLFRRCKSPLILLDGWSERYPFDGVLINNQGFRPPGGGIPDPKRDTGRSAISGVRSGSRPSAPGSWAIARPWRSTTCP